ncbi:MAG: spore germination protein [Bacillus sp. (in: Bacteria)]|nr:spore germination protein [Bacillus sp. (in: firmicutes)]
MNVSGPEVRSVERSETETVINGPHDSFIENAVTNISLIRNRLKTSHLKAVRMQVGRLTKTDVYLLYVDELVDLEIKKELENRISNLEIVGIQDTNMLVQLIDDSPNSIFPQFQTGERPDTAVSKLLEGKVVGLVDGSPNMFSAPTGFFDFFHSPDDYYQRWVIASSIRIIRFFALFITLFFTPLYVAVATYHYDMIPEDLLISMATSRMEVPFPPIYEALFMEFTLELLREAGARLPTKVGQTIGIVGGIVIGQAAVDAGITSNILIIVVAVSALASFVIPNYIMSTSLRLARFVLILLAGILGNFGMMIGIGLIVIHLSGLSNLKKPYMAPISPYKKTAWIDTVIRGPYKEHMISKELSNKKST